MMQWLIKTFALLLVMVVYGQAGSDTSSFTHLRQITGVVPDQENFVVVDQDVWQDARPDLGDIRIYDGGKEIPYVLREQKGGKTVQAVAIKILNLHSARKRTEFDLDMGVPGQYNRIGLQIDARNFVATARIQGWKDANNNDSTDLGQSTLYDFSQENLGSNTLIQLQNSIFRYIHISLPADIHPDQVKAATAYNSSESDAAWTRVGRSPGTLLDDGNTVQHWSFSPQVPVDRIHFAVSPDEQNFRRSVRVTDEAGMQVTSDEISRMTLDSENAPVTLEHLDVDLLGIHSRVLTVTVENKSEPPLKDLTIQPLSIERRIYFDAKGTKSLMLYYGDNRLSAPAYVNDSSFRESTTSTQARLSAPQRNRHYAGTPDERPWQVRHKLAVWSALIIAVLMIAGSALWGMRPSEPHSL